MEGCACQPHGEKKAEYSNASQAEGRRQIKPASLEERRLSTLTPAMRWEEGRLCSPLGGKKAENSYASNAVGRRQIKPAYLEERKLSV
jgi:hypothetical protein